MSTALSPSSDTEPSTAIDRSVILSRTLLLTSKVTSIRSPANSTPLTLPTCTPATRTGDPGARPATLEKRVFSEYRSQKNPRVPVRLKISTAAIVSATIVSTPILSSDHANERVLGIGSPHDKNF